MRGATIDLNDILRAVSPETEAILITARTEVDSAAKVRLSELVNGPVDWPALTGLAARHQVLPLVASTLPALHRADIPEGTADWLDDYTRGHTARNMRMTADLFAVLDALEAADIPAFPYKGPTLAAAAYGSIRYRAFGDLDLLVPKTSYLQAKAVIESIGFASLRSDRSGDRHFLGRKSAHPFAKGDVRLDLQWGSTTRKALSVPIDGSFWDTEATIEILGRSVRAIPPDMLFLFICAHGSRHYWDRLKWICDVAEMIRSHPTLDWRYILETAEKAGAARVVNMAILLADSLLGAPAPTWVLNHSQRDSRAASLAAVAVDHPLTERVNRLETGVAQRRFTMATKERRVDRVRYFADVTLQPNQEDYEWLALPERAAFLYPVLRPMRLVTKAVKRRFRRSQSADGHTSGRPD